MIPLVFVSGMDMLSENSPAFLRQQEPVRKMVDQTYREYLHRYPKDIELRTEYLQFALSVEDWPTVKRQLEELNNYWDMSQIPLWQYAKIAKEASRH